MPRRAWILAALVVVAACATVPYTNRSQLMLVSEDEEAGLGLRVYREELKKAKVIASGPAVDVVRRVGERIARVANRPDFRWEFNLIDDDRQANAFCLPGGKVAVYTGIFPIARDEDGLAAVVGHEVAHALARHGAERMSQGMAAQVGAAGVAVALGQGGADATTSELVLQAYGIGAQVGVLLPYSRSHESEADRIGLTLMAKAGFPPAAALQLWQRMEAAGRREGGVSPPVFLSTHPGHDRRQSDIRQWLAEAEAQFVLVAGYANAPLPAPR